MPTLSTIGAACARAWGFTSGLVKDQYFNLVSLLLPGNGTDGKQNRTFKDSSVNDFLITPNGNATQGTFSPFSQTGWGGNFNGTSFIQAPDNATMQVGTSDFTIEMWAYFTSDFTGAKWIGGKGDQATATGTAFSLYSTAFEVYSGSTVYSLTCPTWSSNRWYHIAIVRSGTGANNLKLYIDGSVQSQASISTNSVNTASGNGFKIGAYSSAGVASYISNFRFVKGRAVYTSAFTPPTSPLGVTTGGQNPPQGTETSLLVLQSNRFIDVANNYTLTLSGSPSVTPFSPFAPTQSYSAAAVGGSGYFDGTGDYLTWTGTAAGSGAFSYEFWIYSTNGFGTFRAPLGVIATSGYNSALDCRMSGTTITAGQYNVTNNNFTVESLQANTWYHVVICRNASNQMTVFLNGQRSSTGALTISTNFSGLTSAIGRLDPSNGGDVTGYITNVRLITGSTPYDPTQTTITVPTAPLTAITNTSLLLNFTNAGVVDATAKNVLETVGNAQISTSVSKFGGGSMRFPQSGTSDYLYKPYDVLLNQLNGNFTMECWIYPTATSTRMIFAGSANSAGNENWFFEITSANKLSFAFSSGVSTFTATSSASISTNTWTYVAAVKNGGTITQYINGSADGTSSPTGTYKNASYGFAIGRAGDYNGLYFTGYIDDFRMTIGQARTITASPTAPFPVQ